MPTKTKDLTNKNTYQSLVSDRLSGKGLVGSFPLDYATKVQNYLGTSSIAGYWKLDNGLPSSNSLTLNGTSSYIDFGNLANIQDLHSAEFTVDFYLYIDSEQTTTCVPFGKGSSTSGWSFYALPQSNLILFRIYDNATNFFQCTYTGITTGQWYHITGYYNNAGDRKPYISVNGTWVNNSNALTNPIGSDVAYSLQAGKISSSSTNWTNGKISWIRISNNDRHGVGVDFTPPSRLVVPTVDANAIVLWGMDEGYGTSAGDLASNNYDGTIYDGSWGSYPVAEDTSGNGYHGTMRGISLQNYANPIFGGQSPFFDGVNDSISVPNSVENDFNGSEGFVSLWLRTTVSEWASTRLMRPLYVLVDTFNRITFQRSVSNQLDIFYEANDIARTVSLTLNTSNWYHVGVSWSSGQDEVRVYLNGSQSGSTLTALGSWSGSLTGFIIGAGSTVPVQAFLGNISHILLTNRAITPSEVSEVYSLSGVQ